MIRRRLAPWVAAGVFLAACSSGDGDVTTERATTSTTTRDATTSRVPETTATSEASTSTEAETTTTGGATPAPTAPPATTAPPPPTTAPRPTAGSPTLGQVRLGLQTVGTFAVPTVFRAHPDGTGYVGEKAGRVRALAGGAVALDIRSLVRDSGEQGFLGMAFNRDGSRLYVSYSDAATGGDSVIAEYAFAGGRADPASRRELLRVDQPASNHNGGDLHLGPDGLLYVALGDGGGSGDPGNHGQRPSTLLGSILRIDPTRPGDGRGYGIPGDNPFAAGGSDSGGAPEVYLYGVRNPWRIAFDAATGDLWVADVGQNQWEEITFLPTSSGRGRGANLGWNRLEGNHQFSGSPPPGAVGPVFEYSHAEGCSITGGFVYRGTAVAGLSGAYLFADLCRSSIRAIRMGADGRVAEERVFGVDAGTPISFGVEASGELLVLSQQGTVYRIVPG